MTADVKSARAELRQAKQSARIASAIEGGGSPGDGAARWLALPFPAGFMASLALFISEDNWAGAAAAAFAALVFGWVACWHWYRHGIRTGIAHTQSEHPS